MKIVVSGSSKDLKYVYAICRNRIRRGSLTITAIPDGQHDRNDEVRKDDDKTVPADEKSFYIQDRKDKNPGDNKNIGKIAKGRKSGKLK